MTELRLYVKAFLYLAEKYNIPISAMSILNEYAEVGNEPGKALTGEERTLIENKLTEFKVIVDGQPDIMLLALTRILAAECRYIRVYTVPVLQNHLFYLPIDGQFFIISETDDIFSISGGYTVGVAELDLMSRLTTVANTTGAGMVLERRGEKDLERFTFVTEESRYMLMCDDGFGEKEPSFTHTEKTDENLRQLYEKVISSEVLQKYAENGPVIEMPEETEGSTSGEAAPADNTPASERKIDYKACLKGMAIAFGVYLIVTVVSLVLRNVL